MLITSITELRLASPAHALDSIDGLVGFIDNSEHDFLEDKLGTPLYNALCQWYDANPVTRTTIADYQTGDWNRLLLLAQRVVAFDALGRAIGMQAISVNNAGINQMVADDYPAPDKNGKTIDLYRDTCTKEAHAALNQMLRQLEQWCKAPAPAAVPEASASGPDSDRAKITDLWRQSRYYYLAAALLIPSCETLQSYLNIYDSREKFIQLLPDLQFIQEEIIANAIGEDLLKTVIDFARDGKLPEDEDPIEGIPVASLTEATLQRLVHRLRKVMVALLVGRTSVLKYTKEQKIQAHDDGVRMLQNVTEYLRTLVPAPAAVPVAAVPEASASGLSTPNASASGSSHACPPPKTGAACWTPPLL